MLTYPTLDMLRDLGLHGMAKGFHAQRLGGIGPAIHVPLLLTVVGLREQPSHQLDEHRHGIVGELLTELDDLRHDQSVSTAGIEVVSQPGRRGIAFTDHLVPTSEDMRA